MAEIVSLAEAVSALVHDGDRIVIDATTGSIELFVEEAELDRRRQEFRPLPPRYTRGVLAKYARLAAGAERGAVTEA